MDTGDTSHHPFTFQLVETAWLDAEIDFGWAQQEEQPCHDTVLELSCALHELCFRDRAGPALDVFGPIAPRCDGGEVTWQGSEWETRVLKLKALPRRFRLKARK